MRVLLGAAIMALCTWAIAKDEDESRSDLRARSLTIVDVLGHERMRLSAPQGHPELVMRDKEGRIMLMLTVHDGVPGLKFNAGKRGGFDVSGVGDGTILRLTDKENNERLILSGGYLGLTEVILQGPDRRIGMELRVGEDGSSGIQLRDANGKEVIWGAPGKEGK